MDTRALKPADFPTDGTLESFKRYQKLCRKHHKNSVVLSRKFSIYSAGMADFAVVLRHFELEVRLDALKNRR